MIQIDLLFRLLCILRCGNEINCINIRNKNSGDIPAHILKMTSDLSFNKVTNIANSMAQSCIFPDPLKLADVSPEYKDGTNTLQNNHRRISILYAFSKVFERLLKRQMVLFMDPKLANIICGLRNRHSTQHALLRFIETIRMHIDQSGVCGMILMNLSKAYDRLPHGVLLAKMEAYGCNIDSQKLMPSYFVGRRQGAK